MSFEFSNLPYATNALEPYIDSKTMEIHHGKHHKAYYDKFTGAIAGTDLANQSLEEIFSSISKQSALVRNNGGGYYNHNIFWQCLAPKNEVNDSPSQGGKLATAIDEQFGSFDAFTEEFSNAAATRFGSGFAWLIVTSDKKLAVTSTPNQDNPLMDVHDTNGTPILALDVWEHAYYLHYQNRRPDYIAAFWNIVNWKWVEERFQQLSS